MEPRDDRTERERARWTLSDEAYQELKEAHAAVVDEFLDPETKLPNVVGMGIGIKLVGGDPERGTVGEPTGEPALIVFVARKVPREVLAENDLIPQELAGKPTDVIESGRETFSQALTQRFRPARGGCSVSDTGRRIRGTLTGAWSTSLNVGPGGVGAPLILSCNHVLADLNRNREGSEPILQPADGDGGTSADRIGTLFRFEPIEFFPPIPLDQQQNLIDAATASRVQFGDLDRQIYWSGYVRGYNSTSPTLIGRQVKKTGRTTGFTLGTIIALNRTVDIGPILGIGTARFREVIGTTKMDEGGDSGSLLTTLDNVAVGLLFSGGINITSYSPIERVQDILRLRVAETFVPLP
jgi:hypothetical protein